MYKGPYFPTECLKYVFVVSVVLVGIKYPKMIGHTLRQWCYLNTCVLNRVDYNVIRDVITKS
jgi:hypothetical protein